MTPDKKITINIQVSGDDLETAAHEAAVVAKALVDEQPKVEEVNDQNEDMAIKTKVEKQEEVAEEVEETKSEETSEVVEETATTETAAEPVETEETTDEEVEEEEAEKVADKKKDEGLTVADVLKASLSTLEKVAETVNRVNEKLDQVIAKQDKAPTEGAAADEDAPEEEAEEAPEEEVKETDSEKTDEAQKVEKAETSSEGALLSTLNEIRDRLKKLEDMPAPTTVRVSKTFAKTEDLPTNTQDELAKIQSELDAIDIKKSKQGFLTEQQTTQALSLIGKKRDLLTQ